MHQCNELTHHSMTLHLLNYSTGGEAGLTKFSRLRPSAPIASENDTTHFHSYLYEHTLHAALARCQATRRYCAGVCIVEVSAVCERACLPWSASPCRGHRAHPSPSPLFRSTFSVVLALRSSACDPRLGLSPAACSTHGVANDSSTSPSLTNDRTFSALSFIRAIFATIDSHTYARRILSTSTRWWSRWVDTS